MNWIKHPLTLQDKLVQLLPLEETHIDELIRVSQEEIIWTYLPVNGTNKEALRGELQNAIAEREKGTQYPFVVIERSTGNIIGSTRFLKLNEEHKQLEIGWTWYLPAYWSKGHNECCKLLLLDYCFEILGTIRVQIITHEKNNRSRKAILRIGASFEGVLRNIVIRNGQKRNSAYYSVIDEEWPEVKQNLATLAREKVTANQHSGF